MTVQVQFQDLATDHIAVPSTWNSVTNSFETGESQTDEISSTHIAVQSYLQTDTHTQTQTERIKHKQPAYVHVSILDDSKILLTSCRVSSPKYQTHC
jgi:hypothetical protein